MLKLLQLLIFGHIHKWIILGSGNIEHRSENGKVVGVYYNLKCEKCGNVKIKKLYS
jgi:hypothetical protein